MESLPAAPAATHVVLDATLARDQPRRFAALLAQFAAGCHGHFFADEAEPTDAWPARIGGPTLPLAARSTRP